jgi:hypothetical protein
MPKDRNGAVPLLITRIFKNTILENLSILSSRIRTVWNQAKWQRAQKLQVQSMQVQPVQRPHIRQMLTTMLSMAVL